MTKFVYPLRGGLYSSGGTASPVPHSLDSSNVIPLTRWSLFPLLPERFFLLGGTAGAGGNARAAQAPSARKRAAGAGEGAAGSGRGLIGSLGGLGFRYSPRGTFCGALCPSLFEHRYLGFRSWASWGFQRAIRIGKVICHTNTNRPRASRG